MEACMNGAFTARRSQAAHEYFRSDILHSVQSISQSSRSFASVKRILPANRIQTAFQKDSATDDLPFRSGKTYGEMKALSYQAPSSSWASTDQPVTWRHYCSLNVTDDPKEVTLWMQVLAISLDLVGNDPLGQLKYAKLDVRCGPLFRGASLKPFLHPPERNSPEDTGPFVLRSYGEACDWGPGCGK